MHPNPIFRKATEVANIVLAQTRSFGALSINGIDGPLLAHIPFLLSDDGTKLEAHLVRSNPIFRALKNPQKAVISVSGGDGYISPDWYGVDDQVPTWNYTAVHLRGTLKPLPPEELLGVLERLSDNMETRLLPKPVWKTEKVEQNVLERMMRQIAPIQMEVETIEGTWKLSQNKSEDVRLKAASALKNDGFGLEYQEIAKLMKTPPA